METHYDIFISFKNSDKDGNKTEDRELAYKLYEFLKSKNLKIFFSEATLKEIGSGAWQKDIKEALKVSKIFIALGTNEEYFKSEWVQWERTTFLTRKEDDISKAIYSYIAPPINIGKLPKDIEYFECFEDTKEDEFERLYSFISNHLARYFHRIDENIFIDDKASNPYKGLNSFEYKDRENYYGREKESKALAKIVQSSRLFTLLGASGSGKSSFICAGILPLIKKDTIKVVSFRPLNNPFKNLALIFISTLYPDKIEQLEKTKELTQKLQNGNVSSIELVEMFLKETQAKKLYLIIDQFEELFTMTKEPKIRNAFLDQLLNLIESSLSITVVISMRSDFLSHISYYQPFNDAFNQNHSSSLGLLDVENIKKVIAEPAKKLAVSFQDGLIDTIVKEITNQAGQLPLLEFALKELWETKVGRVISFESLKKIGGISHSISHYADDVYECHLENQDSIKRILINLVTIGRGTEDTKKVAKIEEFKDKDRDTITLLANERLIVTDEDEIEIVHEALIREWKQLKEWIDEYRDFLQWQERVREDRVFYEEKGNKEEDLLKDSKLLVAKDFLENYSEYISDKDRIFVNKSINIEKQKKRNRWLFIGSIFIFLLGIIWFVLEMKNEAQKAEKNASKSLYKEKKARAFADRKNKSFALLTKTTISTLIQTKNSKLLEYYIKAIVDSGEKEIILDMLTELINNNATMYPNQNEYLNQNLTTMTKDEIIKLLEKLITKRIEIANPNRDILLHYWEYSLKKPNSIYPLQYLSDTYRGINKRNNDWIELKLRKKLFYMNEQKLNSSSKIYESRLKKELTDNLKRIFQLQKNINPKFISKLYQKHLTLIESLKLEYFTTYFSIKTNLYLGYAEERKYNKAIKILTMLIDENNKRNPKKNLEYLYYMKSKYQIMTKKYKDALLTIESYQKPNSSRLQRNLAHAYLLLGNVNKAKTIYSSLNIYAIQKDFKMFIQKGIKSNKFEKIIGFLGIKFSFGLYISKLSNLQFTKMTLTGKKIYKENQSIEFTIDTMGEVGYLYVIYLEKNGTTVILYPNKKSLALILNGKYSFPRDFGNMNIRATKDCKKCEKDETKIYTILTKKPILDIHNITEKELKNFSSKPKSVDTSKANVHFGMIQFFVK